MQVQGTRSIRGKIAGVGMALVVVLSASTPFAQTVSPVEKSFLSMYFTEDELRVVSVTRSLQAIAHVAENIEVVTAVDIELMNAHTLGDVLNTVNGVKVNFTGRFGSTTLGYIQGSVFSQVTVLLDGVLLSDVGNNTTDLGFFPVTDVERIEIIKGPASSAWGSALGGVINVITKDPGMKPFETTASLDYGSKKSADFRATISGRAGRLGYSLSGTGLRTDGLTEGFDVGLGFFAAKLSYDLGARTNATLSLHYGNGSRGDGSYPSDDLSFDRHNHQLVSNLALTSAIGGGGRFDLAVWTVQSKEQAFMRLLSNDLELSRSTNTWSRTGAALKYILSLGAHDLVVGTDYTFAKLDSSDIPDRTPKVAQWALYANDTIRLGGLTMSPGIRYDDISISNNFLSPSLGVTYARSRNSLLRATVARGFSVPSPVDTDAGTSDILMYKGNPDLKVEKVWSYQAGFETNVLDAFWLKASAFRHDLDDAFMSVQLEDGFRTEINGGSERREGIELQARTLPFHNVTLAAGATFMKARNLETGEEILEMPKQLFDVALKYDDGHSFRALLQGNYRREEYDPAYNANFHGFIFDLNVMKKFVITSGTSLEAFLNVHNLFNGPQYWADIFKNPDRWVEGGLRAAF